MAQQQAAVSIDPKNRQGGGRPQGGRDGRRRDNRDQGPKEEKIFQEYVIGIDRVARVVKGGRRFRFKALVAVGDGKQRVGVGVSKGQDVQTAVSKAVDQAKKNLITIPVVNATIPHDVQAKVGGAKVLLKPAAPGTGVIAGGAVRSIINLTGVTNLLSKALGSTNKVNNAYATLEALRQLVPAEQWVQKPAKKAAPRAEKTEEKK
ncbi:MAG TPA: 30S ribosomal protein S5 [Candidatus Saccharimonadales bacterium]|nr:30S ribosomal protein S5 [Candidatus Saccharimonadales bacterium]